MRRQKDLLREQRDTEVSLLAEKGLACRQTFRVDGWTHPSMALVRYSLSARSPTAGIPHLLDQLGVLLGKGYSS